MPEHPYPGQQWKEVRHDKTVTWLAFWKDPISQKDFKYVWLAANSTFKSDSDLAKYEKARKLKVKPSQCCTIVCKQAWAWLLSFCLCLWYGASGVLVLCCLSVCLHMFLLWIPSVAN